MQVRNLKFRVSEQRETGNQTGVFAFGLLGQEFFGMGGSAAA